MQNEYNPELTIALDAMGGDKAPNVVIEGAGLARTRYPKVRFLLYGDRAALEPLLARRPKLAEGAEIVHTDQVVGADDKPSTALRHRRDSSMYRAIQAVRDGAATAVVSAGNTGALMAMAKFGLKTLPGIDRPAIVGLVPTERGESVFLDLGANVDCSADNLIDFAVMGALFARVVLGVVRPTVGLLNIGEEALKGREQLRQARAILSEAETPFDFHGFVEGQDIFAGTTDVVVTDGFTGNVALKSAEGASRLYGRYLRRALRSSPMGRIGYLLARRAFMALREKVDPRAHNGAMFVGVNGIVVKSHGGTDALGFANAIGVARDAAAETINERIIEELAPLHPADETSPAMPAP